VVWFIYAGMYVSACSCIPEASFTLGYPVAPETKCNQVDTGWVTDMAPDGVGTVAATHETWIGPPLDEEDEIVAAVGAYTSLLVQSCSLMSRPLHRTWLSSFVQDGAARVLDPLFSHLKDPTWLLRGKFFKSLGEI